MSSEKCKEIENQIQYNKAVSPAIIVSVLLILLASFIATWEGGKSTNQNQIQLNSVLQQMEVQNGK